MTLKPFSALWHFYRTVRDRIAVSQAAQAFEAMQPVRKYLISLIIISCALLITFTSIIYQQSRLTENSNLSVIRSYDTLQKWRSVLIRAMDAETGQRGFLLTGSSKFLLPYQTALQAIDEEMAVLANDAGGDLRRQGAIQKVRFKIEDLITLLTRQIDVIRENPGKAITLDELAAAKAQMDTIRFAVENAITEEKILLDKRMEELKQRQQQYLFVLFAGAVLALGALGVAGAAILKVLSRSQRTEEELRKSEERFALVMHGLNDGIFDYNVRAGTVEYSPSYKAMLGYTNEEHPDTLEIFNKLLHPEDAESTWRVFRQYAVREIPSYMNIFRLRHKDGSWRWIMARAVGLWDQDGAMYRLIGTHTDITAQKEYEEDLKQLNADLESFTHIASHDMRAPLVNIKGFSDEVSGALHQIMPLMKRAAKSLQEEERQKLERTLDQELPEAIAFIQRGVDKMDKLTDALLDLSRIGRRKYRAETVDTRSVVQQCLDTLAYEIGSKRVEIIMSDLPMMVSDPLAIEHIFANILDNAVKYLDPERPGKIWIQYKRMARETIFSITDNGRGIAAAERRKVFDLFRRAENTGDIRGAGVGMAYVKATVRRLGGRIWFDSMIDTGTTFYISLPHRDIEQASSSDLENAA